MRGAFLHRQDATELGAFRDARVSEGSRGACAITTTANCPDAPLTVSGAGWPSVDSKTERAGLSTSNSCSVGAQNGSPASPNTKS